MNKKTFKKVYKQYLKARYFFKEDCQAVLKEYRPMRNIGMMIKKFFNPKCKQYWICVPSEMESKKLKELFIMDTINFLNDKINIKDD